jgi:hypothetical protein
VLVLVLVLVLELELGDREEEGLRAPLTLRALGARVVGGLALENLGQGLPALSWSVASRERRTEHEEEHQDCEPESGKQACSS